MSFKKRGVSPDRLAPSFCLLDILSRSGRDSEEVLLGRARNILNQFGSLEAISSLTAEELSLVVGKRAATLIKLYAYIASRRVTDKFRYGQKHTREEILDLIIATFMGLSRESSYIMSFDKAGRAIALDFVLEGSINATEVSPRISVELALRRGAHSVIVAHNHPLSSTAPSEADMATTRYIAEVLRSVGVKLISSVIVAERTCSVTTLGENYFEDDRTTIEYYEYGKGAPLSSGG